MAKDPSTQTNNHALRLPENSQGPQRSATRFGEESISTDVQNGAVTESTRDENETALSRTSTTDPSITQHSLAGSYRRPSHIASGPRPFLGLASQNAESTIPTDEEREAALDEERDLLADNNLIRPRRPNRRESQNSNTSSRRSLKQRGSNYSFKKYQPRASIPDEEAAIDIPTEDTALLPNNFPGTDSPTAEDISKQWEDAILTGAIQTTWRREARTLLNYSWPLMFTYLLQNSLTLTSVFTVGHIGKNELGAVSLGGMTANITGYAIYHGLATSLDTLCAQAYGSGKKKLVGLNLQRMVLFLWTITIPIAIVWFFAESILQKIVPEKEIAILAGRYLKVLIIGAPGYSAFESSKRYVQAQGRFTATLYVLLIAAPLNVLLHWLFVWVSLLLNNLALVNTNPVQRFSWGFIGCPIAIVITETLMPILLALYVRFVGGLECWPGLTRSMFRNWGPMVKLALPGLVMVQLRRSYLLPIF
jgi:multidrug resistance protein, MATE family